jgi:hypothetical protein
MARTVRDAALETRAARARLKPQGKPYYRTGPITLQARPSWRDVLLVHQAADLFKLMTDDELMALGKDIEENGLKVPVVFIEVDDSPLKMTTRVGRKTVETSIALLDGRNRLDALEARGPKVK